MTTSGTAGAVPAGQPGLCYEIRVRGRLTAGVTATLRQIALAAEGVETVFTGRVVDQTQLRGLLDHLLDAGLEIVEVHRVPPGAPVGPVEPDRAG